jgi:phage terminase small subunit
MSQNVADSGIEYKKRKLIAALLSTRTKTDAAAAAGISRATVTRWLKDPDFQAMLKEASLQLEQRTIDESMRRLTAGIKNALDVLEVVMRTGDATNRRQAAVSWVDSWRIIREQTEIDERLTALEEGRAAAKDLN